MNDPLTSAGLTTTPAGTASSQLIVDFPACVHREFPGEFPLAWAAVQQTLATLDGANLSSLAMRSPGLSGYDWSWYLRCSVARMVRALAALTAHVPPPARVLDFGSYLGNFALMLARAGYEVHAADSYTAYERALAPVVRSLREAGIAVIDTTGASDSLARVLAGPYDAILAMGVIEHVPHTPRPWLEAIDAVLRRGGLLIMDTPNLAYLYTRQRLLRGESILCPIELQYYSALPYEGHHREYTLEEVRWMVNAIGHEPLELSTFNYSFYGLDVLQGLDLDNHRRMEADPTLREVILSVSRKRRDNGNVLR